MAGFAGIDLTCTERKRTAYALLRVEHGIQPPLTIVRSHLLGSDADIIARLERDRPRIVGIDAPLTRPKGLHCFDSDCSCTDPLPKGRECERALARERINSYFTTKNSIIREMIVRAMKLARDLKDRGFEVIEVYPHATKFRLWRKHLEEGQRTFPRKTSPAGRSFLRDRLSGIIGNIEGYPALTHDELDAVVAAYTAYLHDAGESDLIGDSLEGCICVPRLS